MQKLSVLFMTMVSGMLISVSALADNQDSAYAYPAGNETIAIARTSNFWGAIFGHDTKPAPYERPYSGYYESAGNSSYNSQDPNFSPMRATPQYRAQQKRPTYVASNKGVRVSNKPILDEDEEEDEDSLPYERKEDARRSERGQTQAVGACPRCSEYDKQRLLARSNELERRAAQSGPVRSNMSIMQRLSRNAVPYGRSKVGYCYRGVKQIIRASDPAAGKYLNGGSAWMAKRELENAGYVNDPNSCRTPGVVRVYKGAAHGMGSKQARQYIKQKFGRNATAGDTHGHVEVLSNDGRYCHFTCSKTPIDDPRTHFGPARRILIGCMVKKG